MTDHEFEALLFLVKRRKDMEGAHGEFLANAEQILNDELEARNILRGGD